MAGASWGARHRLILLFSLSVSALAGCAEEQTTTVRDRISPIYQGPAEADYCDETYTYSDFVTITGKATYQTRELNGSGLGAAGAAKPIRYAEVRATNSRGVVVQCAETEDDGDFIVTLPRGSAAYTIAVTTRADNAQYKVSVLNQPERNEFFQVSTTVVPDQSKGVGTLNAGVTGEVLGAAFNILDKVLDANIYLRAEADCATDFPSSGCSNFTVAPKVTAYWTKGFNPNSYFSANSTKGLSFYLPGYRRLFILGGINGNLDSSDTDHFDNSIILHEYAHFLEDVYTKTDSPGGPHSGNRLIDPRLAWGEGWANFFQAAVLDDPRYIDTRGNIDGNTSYIFNIDLEDFAVGATTCTAGNLTSGCDVPVQDGEGNFREFSVTRLLWDAIDSGGSNDESVVSSFSEIWRVLVSAQAFLQPDVAFRAIGYFHESQASLASSQDWSTLRTLHKHDGDRTQYARWVKSSGTSCDYTMTPYNDPNDGGDYDTSNWLSNNDFFHYYHPGGAFRVELNYATAGGATVPEADLDLVLYNEDAGFGNPADVVAASQLTPDNNKATAQAELINLTNLPAGDYLINVMLWTGSYTGGPFYGITTFSLEFGNSGAFLCPAAFP